MWRNKKSCALGNGLITKTYFYARVGKTYTNNFEKHEYMLQNGKKALVHYLGNEKSYVDRCHGNSTKSKSFFYRSSHYVFDQVLAQGKNKPMDAYRSLLSNDPGGHISTSIIPRNPKQVANIMTRNAEKNNFHNKDEVWNSHLVAYSIHPFVRKIESYPDICIVMCCEKIVAQMEEMLELLPCKEITLHYDTTFNLGNYYLSCLAYRHVCLETKRNKYLYSLPTVPFAFFIHEKRLAQNHKYFFQTLKENVCGKNFNKSRNCKSHEILVEKPVKSDLPKLVYSISSLAKDILNKNGVVFVPQNRSWSVKESETIIHSVNLNPPAHCTCGASKNCVHILAVQYLSGNVNSLEHFEGKKRNLTSLIQKNRLKVERKSGKKKPRKCDIDSNLKTLNFCELAVPKNESFSIKQNEQSTVPEIKYPISRGLQWGVGLVLNSCTIDNTLTMLKLRCHADKYFLNRLGTSEAEIELKKAMRYLNNDDDNYGKEIWASFLKSKIQITSSPCFNLYGSSKTFFFNHFKEAFTFESVGKCFTCLNSSFHLFDFIELPPNHDPTDYLLGYLKDKRLLLNCLVCGNKELNHCGTTLKSQNTWMIVIECDIPNISISSLMNLPKKNLIEKCYFSLACITLGLNAHFTSLHYIRDQWFFYDGMQKNGKLTKMIPYNWQNKVANHVIYLID
ncbi:uncharacterized protein LOC124806202 [Hydra vulgaris]|uniref:uncharacterized protein LOC124806202 n=1 Tax=Hydra vulgaris TaxID=6087 RepID=UPI0032EA22B8